MPAVTGHRKKVRAAAAGRGPGSAVALRQEGDPDRIPPRVGQARGLAGQALQSAARAEVAPDHPGQNLQVTGRSPHPRPKPAAAGFCSGPSSFMSCDCPPVVNVGTDAALFDAMTNQRSREGTLALMPTR